MEYVLQHRDFGLGNFINLTPAITWLHQQRRQRVPVYFETDYVRECFLDRQEIEILDKCPETGPLFGSNLINPNDDKPDYQYVFEQITGRAWSANWHTFVDTPRMSKKEMQQFDASYVLIINGSGSDASEYVATKDPGARAYIEAISGIRHITNLFNVFAVGSNADAQRAPYLESIANGCFFGDIRQALKLMAHHGCRMVISNECGLAHAAGAMNAPVMVIWKDTPRQRCKNPGTNTIYYYPEQWQQKLHTV